MIKTHIYTASTASMFRLKLGNVYSWSTIFLISAGCGPTLPLSSLKEKNTTTTPPPRLAFKKKKINKKMAESALVT